MQDMEERPDPGAVYFGRQEKDDALKLALAAGDLLEDRGFDVMYTRVDDVYHTPYEKADMGNSAGADYFISIHRNAAGIPGTASGIMTLVYEDAGVNGRLARAVNEELEKTGYQDLGVVERPGLAVLRRTAMPAILIEAGFIDNPQDNQLFDQQFEAIAEAVADGVEKAVRERRKRGSCQSTIWCRQGPTACVPWPSSSLQSFSPRDIRLFWSTTTAITM